MKTEIVGESINKDDSIEVEFTWTVPNEDKDTLTLSFAIEAGSGTFEIQQCDSCDESVTDGKDNDCLLYTSPSPRDQRGSRMPCWA